MRYSQRDFRQNGGATVDETVAILKNLFEVLSAVHKQSVVVGDFNDLNVLVQGTKASLIDADSMQFGGFHCMTFTSTFADPLLCGPGPKGPVLVKPHNVQSDVYAFTVMVMQALLFVGPYGGVYKSKDISHVQRPMHRITVFNSEVRYPKPAIPFNVLPDDFLHQLQQVFEKDRRDTTFPVQLLERFRWTKCASCGAEHGRATCPTCCKQAPAAVKTTTTVRGQVTATRIFPSGTQRNARILRADVQNGKLLWFYTDRDNLYRETGACIGSMSFHDPHLRLRARAQDSWVGKGTRLLSPSTLSPTQEIDAIGNTPLFETNADHVFWVHRGVLYCDTGAPGGSKRVGDVLRGQTRFWVGPAFGFGLSRAGALNIAFVFTASGQSLNDSVKLPPINGKLVDARCSFTKDLVWFFTTAQEGSQTINRCTVIRANGDVEATAEAVFGDGSWLGKIYGGAATGSSLLMPTDVGVVQLKIDAGRVVESKQFPDTEQFVDSNSKLLVGADGLYVVTTAEITRLVIR